jgi:hypothetical protein
MTVKVKVVDLKTKPKLRETLAKAARTQRKRADAREKNWFERWFWGSK